MISVVVPVFNGEEVLADQLDALCRQKVTAPWELIVSDNGSTDGSRKVAELYMTQLPIRVVDSSARRGNAAARNIGASASSGDFLLFLDQDDEACEQWLEAMTAALREADLVVGPMPIQRNWASRSIGEASTTLQTNPYGWLPYGLSANMAIRRTAFEALGGFDEAYQAATDVDICWRAQVRGMSFASCETAVVLKRTKHHGAFRQHQQFGRDDVELYRRFRKLGMPSDRIGTAKRYGWLLKNLPLLWRQRTRWSWVRLAGKSVGRLQGSVRNRVLYL